MTVRVNFEKGHGIEKCDIKDLFNLTNERIDSSEADYYCKSIDSNGVLFITSLTTDEYVNEVLDDNNLWGRIQECQDDKNIYCNDYGCHSWAIQKPQEAGSAWIESGHADSEREAEEAINKYIIASDLESNSCTWDFLIDLIDNLDLDELK